MRSELHFHPGLEEEKRGIRENELRETRCGYQVLHLNMWVEYVVGFIMGITHQSMEKRESYLSLPQG